MIHALQILRHLKHFLTSVNILSAKILQLLAVAFENIRKVFYVRAIFNININLNEIED